MSRFFFESFFPATTALILRPWLPRTYSTIFPDDVAVACPEVVLLLFPSWSDGESEDSMIRNPILALNAAIGLTLGLVGGVTLLQTQQLQQNDQRKWRQQQQQQHPQSPSPSKNNNNNQITARYNSCCTTAWAWSLIGYGLMNATALPLHSLVPAPQQTCVQDYSWLWMLDCYFTGVSAMALVTAVRRECIAARHSTYDDGDDAPAGISVGQEWALWNLPGTLAVLAFVLFGHTLPLEQWYLGPTLLALCSMLLWRLWLFQRRGNHRNPSSSSLGHGTVRDDTLWTILMAVAVTVGVGGILGDAPTCRWGWQGAKGFLDFFAAGNAVFAACNVAFSAILWRSWKHLQERQHQQQPIPKDNAKKSQ